MDSNKIKIEGKDNKLILSFSYPLYVGFKSIVVNSHLGLFEFLKDKISNNEDVLLDKYFDSNISKIIHDLVSNVGGKVFNLDAYFEPDQVEFHIYIIVQFFSPHELVKALLVYK